MFAFLVFPLDRWRRDIGLGQDDRLLLGFCFGCRFFDNLKDLVRRFLDCGVLRRGLSGWLLFNNRFLDGLRGLLLAARGEEQ